MSKYYFPLYKEPKVIENVLTHEECDYLIDIARDKLEVSKVGNGFVNIELRNSETYQINPIDEDDMITKIRKRCSHISTFPYNYTEFQITHYKKGGYYGPHHDRVEARPTKRVCTLIIALNDDYEGGETNFIYLYKSFKMKKGDALFFYTADQRDKQSDFAMHEGAEVTSGEKWIANVWIHDTKQFPLLKK